MAFDRKSVVRQPLGRPSSYRPEYAQQLIDYFEAPAFPQTIINEAGEPVQVTGLFPTLARFATFCGVNQNTLRNWADAKDMDDTPLFPEFFRAYYLVQAYQEAHLTEGYSSGAYANPGFGALIAKNLLAWKDKQEVESTVTQTTDLTVSVGGSLAETLAKAKAKAGVE